MGRWLVRFGYDGRAFAGWARQPGARTVEGELRRGLAGRTRDRAVPASLEVASRTDRGVSARANAMTLTSPWGGGPLLRILNGISSEIFATAAAPVPEEFRVRRAARRVYRYFEPGPGIDLERRARAAALFSGPIDVRSFGRAIPGDRPVLRDVASVRISPIDGGAVIEVAAPSFVWGEVRKIVAALREHAAGRLSLERLAAAVAGRARLPLPLAEPDRLVLWDVEYPVDWTHRWSGPNRHQTTRARAETERAWAQRWVLDALGSGVD